MKRMQTALTILAMMMLAVGSAFGGSAIIGSVAGSKNATIDGEALVPNTTVFSGDSLRVKECAAAAVEAAGEAANAAGCATNEVSDNPSAYTVLRRASAATKQIKNSRNSTRAASRQPT